MTTLLLCLPLLLLVGSAANVGAAFVSTSGTKILDENGQEHFFSGINLGNWLLWEGYLMMGDFNYRTHTQFFNELADALGGSDKAAEFEYQWRLNYVDETVIYDLKSLGFNSVRVPFSYKLFYDQDTAQIIDDGFEFFDRLIGWCRTHGMHILLDMHAAPGYQNPGDHSDNVDSNASQPRGTVKFWDGQDNIALAASIWKHIATRYANEPVIWGYDLINEPVPQDGREYELLPSYLVMRDAIREVDNNHIIVAEGSWWGSDLTKIDWLDSQVQSSTGITSQWDDKLVYQIHHYGPASGTYGREQITNNLNIPLFIGEYGETDESNLQAITDWAKQTLQGYYPWSFKKMSHDRCLWTIPPNDTYNQVKSYINNGGTPPTHLYDEMISFAQINIKNGHESIEWHNGFYQAIKPSITCSESAGFVIPGLIQAEDYCEHQGVQLESTSDTGGGQNVGYLDTGDYTKYRINVANSGQYIFEARIASDWSTGLMDVKVDENVLASFSIPDTGGWQSWQTLSSSFYLTSGGHNLELSFPGGGFNVNWVSFTAEPDSSPTSIPTTAPSKAPIISTPPPTASPIQATSSPTKSQVVTLAPSKAPVQPTTPPSRTPTEYTATPSASPVGAGVDCTTASAFTVPGYIQAEQYCDHQGVELESASDVGGGHNIFQLDNADYSEYNIDVSSSNQYTFSARVFSPVYSGQINLQVDNISKLWLSVPHTQGAWRTIHANVYLDAGVHRLRVAFPQGGFKLNYMSFGSGTNNPLPPPITASSPPTPSPSSGSVVTSSPTFAPSTSGPTSQSPTQSSASMTPSSVVTTNVPPTKVPSKSPSRNPTSSPSSTPTKAPTTAPTTAPPTYSPTTTPTNIPPTGGCSTFSVPGDLVAEQHCSQQGVEIKASTDAGGGQMISSLSNGDFVEFDINVAFNGQYTFAARVTSPTYSGQINVQTNGNSVLWMSVPHTNGGWQTIFANVWLNAGSYKLRVAFPQGGFEVSWFAFRAGVNNPP